MKIVIKDETLRQAASDMDAFVGVFVEKLREAIGGEPTAETLQQLTADQVTLLAWDTLHREVSEGGFVQLISNGYGPFIFHNPFAKALKLWGLADLAKMVYRGRELYDKYGAELESECSDEEFMARYEQFPAFDDLDDAFVLGEEAWTEQIATYVDDHLDNFAVIEE